MCSGERFPVVPGRSCLRLCRWFRFEIGAFCFLRDNVRYFRTEPVFLCSFHLISFLVPGLRACSAGRDTEKTTNPSGFCLVSYGEPRRQLNSHNGKEYLSFPGKYATKQAPSVPREGGRGQKWAQEPIPAAWCERKLYITAFAVRIGAAFCFRAAPDQNRKRKNNKGEGQV